MKVTDLFCISPAHLFVSADIFSFTAASKTLKTSCGVTSSIAEYRKWTVASTAALGMIKSRVNSEAELKSADVLWPLAVDVVADAGESASESKQKQKQCFFDLAKCSCFWQRYLN